MRPQDIMLADIDKDSKSLSIDAKKYRTVLCGSEWALQSLTNKLLARTATPHSPFARADILANVRHMWQCTRTSQKPPLVYRQDNYESLWKETCKELTRKFRYTIRDVLKGEPHVDEAFIVGEGTKDKDWVSAWFGDIFRYTDEQTAVGLEPLGTQ
jgi:hypothetical protein